MREERIELSQGERDRLKVLHHVEQGYLTQAEAGQQVQVSTRQGQRRRYADFGPTLASVEHLARQGLRVSRETLLAVDDRRRAVAVPPPATPFGLRPTGLAAQQNPKPKRKYIPPPHHPGRRTFLSGKKADISALR